LTKLKKTITEKKKCSWTVEAENEIKNISALFKNVCTLRHSYRHQRIYIQTDGSVTAMGAVFFQIPSGKSIEDEVSDMDIISFISRKLTPKQTNYSVID
jgi:RNase H-like domain found in reverse transcriptase